MRQARPFFVKMWPEYETEIETPGVNFINVFTYKFFVQRAYWQLFLVTFWLWQKICTKIREFNVDEIDGWSTTTTQ